MRVSENGRSTRNLGHRADVGRDDRTGARHRLEDRQSEGLVERRVHQEIRRSVEVDGLLVRHTTDEDDVVGDAELGGQLVEFGRVLLVTLGSDNDELASRQLVADQLPGTQQAVSVLVAP